jgi:dolichol-phosphate mannosyltransferase
MNKIGLSIQKLLKPKLFKFAVTGSIGLIIDLYVTWFIKEKLRMDQYLAHSIGFLFAVVNNYLINKYWTFNDSSKRTSKEFFIFFGISLFGLGLNTLCLLAFVKCFRLSFYLSKILSILLTFFWNYFSNSVLTFKREVIA